MDPQLSKMLICSPDYNCSEEIVNIVASMSVPQIFLRPRESAKAADEAKAQFVDVTSDHITLLNAFAAYEEVPITERKQVREGAVRRELLLLFIDRNNGSKTKSFFFFFCHSGVGITS